MSKSVYYYIPLAKDDLEIEITLGQKAEQHPEGGFWVAYHRLKVQGKPWNHKRIYSQDS
jgi:putative transposase